MKSPNFSSSQVIKLTGISKSSLDNWVRSGIAIPSISPGGRGQRRGWSFTDIIGLRVITMLTHEYHIPIRQIRRLLPELRTHTGRAHNLSALAGSQLAVTGNSVILLKTSKAYDVLVDVLESPGQMLLAVVPLEHVLWDVQRRIQENQKKDPSLKEKIRQLKSAKTWQAA